ncbi:MAG: glycosyltransferase family 4 protein [Planctomycetota bacterium]
MHVLFLSDNFPPEMNAPASRLHEHARRWVEAGHRVTVITCAPNFPGGKVFEGYENRWCTREEVDGIEVVRVKTFIVANRGFLLRTLDYLSFMVAAFVAGLFQNRPDVVVATSPQFFAACGGWALAAVRRLPFVFELRDIWPASLEAVGASKNRLLIRFFERIELFLYRRARAIIAVTRSFKEELVHRGIDGDKIHVVTNGVDLTRYTPQQRDPALAREMGVDGKFVVGYVGTHGMAHALDNCLAAAEQLRGRTNVHLLFVGDGAAREALLEQKERLRLDNVTLHPPMPKEQMPAIWGLCDVALVHLRDAPLFETVIPSKLFEAMGMGLPVVIACPEGEATSIVRATGCGRVVAPEDPNALATCLEFLSKGPAMMRTLRERSLAAAPRYSRDQLAGEMMGHLLVAAGLPPERTEERPHVAPPDRAAAA